MNTKLHTCNSYLNAFIKLSELSYKLLQNNNCNIKLAQILPKDNNIYIVQILYIIEE